MKRRNFLFNSGILASAIIVSPSAAWSADRPNKTSVLIIQDTLADRSDLINSVIKKSSAQTIHELAEEDVSDLVYSSNGFLVTMNNGKTYIAEKVIFSSHKEIDLSQSSIKVKTGDRHIQLRYDAASNKTTAPEFWALTTRKFDNGKVATFMKRKRHAFLCIS